jgi:hypothetical protein
MIPTIDKLKVGDIVVTKEMIRSVEIVGIRGNDLIVAFADADWSKDFLGLHKLDVQVLIDNVDGWRRGDFDMLNEDAKDAIIILRERWNIHDN